jgi:hypothetical protein
VAQVISGKGVLDKRTTYQWNKWSDGQVWLLEPGVDYVQGKEHRVRNAAYTYAKKAGIQARTSQTAQGVVIQFMRPPAPTKAPRRRIPRSVA